MAIEQGGFSIGAEMAAVISELEACEGMPLGKIVVRISAASELAIQIEAKESHERRGPWPDAEPIDCVQQPDGYWR